MKKWYSPADLLHKKAVFVYNLEPRKLMKLDSQGMLLAGDGPDGKPVLVAMSSDVPNGTRIK